jgi:isochorismate synthase EntC
MFLPPHCRPLARKDEAEDQRLEREMLASEKERAEHIMLVTWGATILGASVNTAQ